MTRNAEAYLRMRLQRARDVAQMAASIMEDPEWIISAMVEAGVLERWDPQRTNSPWVRVVRKPPHVHEWAVIPKESTVFAVTVGCAKDGCLEKWSAANVLPITRPE